MFRNYIKITLRSMLRQKGYTFINMSGLAIGMAACILILLYVQDELSFDKYHEKHERVYRISRKWFNSDGAVSLHLGHVAPPFGPLIENDFEGAVEDVVRFRSASPLMVYEDKKIVEDRFFFADAEVFDVFSWVLPEGDPGKVLTEPNSIVLTETTAKKYFGESDPIGKVIHFNYYDNEIPMKVTGIMEDVPLNSHFKFDILASFSTFENFYGVENLMTNFGSNNFATYLLFKEGDDVKNFEEQIPEFMDRHLSHHFAGSAREPHEATMLELMPLTDIHLHSHLDSEIEANSDVFYVRLYTIIAIFILIIACVNFMNLSTARSARRSREVGIRKVMGAFKKVLVSQFLIESVVYAVFALLVGLLIVALLLPWFNDFVQRDLSLNVLENGFAAALMLGVIIFTGIVAGSYPSFYLSRFQPATILKKGPGTDKSSAWLRSGLVIFQFSLSIALIIGVGVVQHQIDYMRSKSLGFDKSNLYVLPVNTEIYNRYESLRTQFLQQPGIGDVILSSRMPSGRLLDSQGATAEVDGEMVNITSRIADIHVDHGYLETLGVEFVAGRNFDSELASDSTQAFILNESAVEAIGWESPEAAIGKQFDYGGREGGQIIGVVKDFHFESLHQSIAPIVFLITSGRASNITFKVEEGKEEDVLAYLKEQWTYLSPGYPFSYYTVADRFSERYNNEDRLSSVVKYFSILAIIIACMGLFGLSSFTAEQRIKEIGIRKVFGATVSNVVILLTRNFTVLVLISFVIASGLAWYLSSNWLQQFAYSGGMPLTIYVFAGIFSVIIAWVTVGFQTIRAATSNPVDAIKYE